MNRFFSLLLEECCEFEESPGSLLPSETSSNGATEDSGSLWSSLGSNMMPAVGNTSLGPGGLGTGVSYQDSLRRCSQRKKSDMLLLGCASLLASVALGQDLLQLGKIQVGNRTRAKQGSCKTPTVISTSTEESSRSLLIWTVIHSYNKQKILLFLKTLSPDMAEFT